MSEEKEMFVNILYPEEAITETDEFIDFCRKDTHIHFLTLAYSLECSSFVSSMIKRCRNSEIELALQIRYIYWEDLYWYFISVPMEEKDKMLALIETHKLVAKKSGKMYFGGQGYNFPEFSENMFIISVNHSRSD